MQEEWRVIEEYPRYSVSNTWKVRNNKTGRILKTDSSGCVTLYSGTRATRVYKSVYGLYRQSFCGYPDYTRARTKIRVIETGNIYFGYKEACEGLGFPVAYRNAICTAVFSRRKDGTRRKVRGYSFELIEDVA